MQCILAVSDFSQKLLPWRLFKVNAFKFFNTVSTMKTLN